MFYLWQKKTGQIIRNKFIKRDNKVYKRDWARDENVI